MFVGVLLVVPRGGSRAPDFCAKHPNHPSCKTTTTTLPTTTTTTTPNSGEPIPIAGQNYSLAFSDDFDTLDAYLGADPLNDTNKWQRLWYQWRTGIPSGRVYVQNSILHLITNPGEASTSISTRRASQAGSSAWMPSSSSGGVYMEARMRWQSGIGTYPQFWSLSLPHSFGQDCRTDTQWMPGVPLLNSELDVMEGSATAGTWWGTLHRNTGSACGVSDTQNGNNTKTGVSQDTFHTWAVKWQGLGTSASVSWYLDDVLQMTAPGYDSTKIPMFLILASAGRTTMTAPNDTQFDWVRVWQK